MKRMRFDQKEGLRKPHALPSLIAVTKLQQLADTRDLDFARFCESLEETPYLAHNVLRMARAAGNGRWYEVADLRHAVSLLGLQQIRDLLIKTRSLVERHSQHDAGESDLIPNHSNATGEILN